MITCCPLLDSTCVHYILSFVIPVGHTRAYSFDVYFISMFFSVQCKKPMNCSFPDKHDIEYWESPKHVDKKTWKKFRSSYLQECDEAQIHKTKNKKEEQMHAYICFHAHSPARLWQRACCCFFDRITRYNQGGIA